MREAIRAKFRTIERKRLAGDVDAAIQMNCIECMGGDFEEAKRCADTGCPLWPHSMAARQDRLVELRTLANRRKSKQAGLVNRRRLARQITSGGQNER